MTWHIQDSGRFELPTYFGINPPPLSEAYVTTFYMGKFSGETPKRHKLWSNDFRLLELIFGKAGYMSKVEQERCPGKTTRKYTDGHGKVRHVGIKDNLRNSQYCLNKLSLLTDLHLHGWHLPPPKKKQSDVSPHKAFHQRVWGVYRPPCFEPVTSSWAALYIYDYM